MKVESVSGIILLTFLKVFKLVEPIINKLLLGTFHFLPPDSATDEFPV